MSTMRALISVSDKTGLKEFAKGLVKLGWEIVSTGGTFKFLTDAKIGNLTKVEDLTGFPEIMDGRVKTLHPKIFGGILADRAKANHLADAKKNKIELIDLVVCNLYPFSQTAANPNASQEEIIENIDIGGVSLIRAAAKNYQHVLIVVEPADYKEVLRQLPTNNLADLKSSLFQKAFLHTATYDRAIADYFSRHKNLSIPLEKISDLRYGENPHQQAAWYKEPGFAGTGIVNAQILHGKELSYNNILDADGALALIKEFDRPAAAIIKHTNPCGCAVADDITEAFERAYAADSLSAFGGVIVINRPCTVKIAAAINKVFAELVIAPEFDDEALAILKQKKNLRLLRTGDLNDAPKSSIIKDYRKVFGGWLQQDYNSHQLSEKDFKVVTKKSPAKQELKDLLFAWQVVKHVKSNAIVLVKDGVTVGIGAGQMSRVESVDIALKKAGDKIQGSVCASDAFFPFRDSIDKLAQFRVQSIVQPGGSIKDDEVIASADEKGLSMVFTGIRAFKH
ncbi:MAG: bifunctional phosphoribosylaminoimidazolecarboxamide formyltransferase/IMP cyclohydrolase [Candidatus Komeilibacteria bacterium]|nr:bifunctional phosphoribosylaminoimidazolecarboxamide formyltransferase/IMP cyclohydrolase [Candidatus Komeilibacteria bacterium]